MLEWVAGAGTALKAASGVLKDLRGMKTDAAVMEKTIELNGLILDIQEQFLAAQAERAEMAKKIELLQAELDQRHDWAVISAHYQPYKFENGAFVYAAHTPNGEVDHYICPNCYEDKKKGVLQPCTLQRGKGLKCGRCKTEILTKSFNSSFTMI